MRNRVEEVNETLKAYSACRIDHLCFLCPISKIAEYGKCSDILDDQVMEALKRLAYLESRLQATKESDINNFEVMFERFFISVEHESDSIYVRTYNAIRRNKITSIKQFAETDPKVFMRMRNVGRKSLEVINMRYNEAREMLGLEPIMFNEDDITFILDMKAKPEYYKKEHGYYS